jgi:uncharacterized protein (DUF2141 family)
MFSLLLIIHSFFFGPTFVEKGTLIVEVQNIQVDQGMVWLGIYRSEDDFMIKEKSILLGEQVQNQEQMTLQIPDLPFGEYAFAIFHDENNNGTMDQNLVGIPSEPFAFSKKPPSKFRLPKFDEVKFNFQKEQLKITAELKKWWQS